MSEDSSASTSVSEDESSSSPPTASSKPSNSGSPARSSSQSRSSRSKGDSRSLASSLRRISRRRRLGRSGSKGDSNKAEKRNTSYCHKRRVDEHDARREEGRKYRGDGGYGVFECRDEIWRNLSYLKRPIYFPPPLYTHIHCHIRTIRIK